MAHQREEAMKRADVRAAEDAQLARVHARNVLQQQRCACRPRRIAATLSGNPCLHFCMHTGMHAEANPQVCNTVMLL